MLGKKGLFQNMFSGYSTELSTSSERLTRFEPTHQRAPLSGQSETKTSARPALTEEDVMRRFGPAFDRDPRYDDRRPMRPVAVPQEEAQVSQAVMPDLEENWFSNEGVEDIPMSVIRRSLPDRFDEMEAEQDQIIQDFPLQKMAVGLRA